MCCALPGSPPAPGARRAARRAGVRQLPASRHRPPRRERAGGAANQGGNRVVVDDAYLATLASAWPAGSGEVGVAPRVFLRKLVGDVHDRVDQFRDFDPRRDYALTINDGELTDADRQAASPDDIELDVAGP